MKKKKEPERGNNCTRSKALCRRKTVRKHIFCSPARLFFSRAFLPKCFSRNGRTPGHLLMSTRSFASIFSFGASPTPQGPLTLTRWRTEAWDFKCVEAFVFGSRSMAARRSLTLFFSASSAQPPHPHRRPTPSRITYSATLSPPHRPRNSSPCSPSSRSASSAGLPLSLPPLALPQRRRRSGRLSSPRSRTETPRPRSSCWAPRPTSSAAPTRAPPRTGRPGLRCRT